MSPGVNDIVAHTFTANDSVDTSAIIDVIPITNANSPFKFCYFSPPPLSI